jgi:hypothetical protein
LITELLGLRALSLIDQLPLERGCRLIYLPQLLGRCCSITSTVCGVPILQRVELPHERIRDLIRE